MMHFAGVHVWLGMFFFRGSALLRKFRSGGLRAQKGSSCGEALTFGVVSGTTGFLLMSRACI